MKTYSFKKSSLGFLVIAAAVTVASCGNEDSNSSNKKDVMAADTSTTISADTRDTSNAKPVKRIRKGKASAMVAMDNTIKIVKDKEGVYSKADQMPQYPGGENALSSFVENNISYPQNAIDQDKEGTVIVSFVIDEKGKVIKPVATGKGAGYGFDEEAVKIVNRMPDWKPGMVKGKPVKTRLSLPVTFKLADS